jgi:Flp pilus assembly protein TadG
MPNPFRKMSSNGRKRAAPGLLGRLARDNRGNTLAMVGAAMVPLAGMIGSGLDMSRAYMAKNRLQSACDAASLAGRRVMTNDTLSTAVTSEAVRFFNFNFPQGLYQTAAFTPQVTRPAQGTIRVTASTTIPTTIMKLFGYTSLPLSVTCDASQNFVNTDIVLVLDVTGSMLNDVNDNPTSNTADQKITALRDAVMALYDELRPIQTQLEAAGMRLRYSIVPYSSSVNVGRLIYDVNPNYIVNSAEYQSRQPIYTVTQANVTQSACSTNPGWSWRANSRGATLGTCTYTTTDPNAGGTFSGNYDYDQIRHDTSTYKTFVATPLPTRQPGTSTTSLWAGCIEERDTVSTITANSNYTIPTGAYDLNVDLIPSSDETRWRPLWQGVEYTRGGSAVSGANAACPTAAKRLTAWTRSDMVNYVNSLSPAGGTYHDIGMIWGARLISTGGIFADSCDTYNGMPCSRHIIFMTDGDMKPQGNIYSAYGYESLDERITGNYTTDTALKAVHNQRFKMVCNEAKGMNVSIWMIAFGTAATPEMNECASNSNQVATVANRDDLIDKFTEIGKNIGSLRLTQ